MCPHRTEAAFQHALRLAVLAFLLSAIGLPLPGLVAQAAAPDDDGDSPSVDLAALELSADCNSNGVLDEDEIAADSGLDCNGNAVLDVCEIDSGSGAPGGPFFCDSSAPPGGLLFCDPDCNENGAPDGCDLVDRISEDCDGNSVPDECEFVDCNNNGVHDACDALPIGVGTRLPYIIVPQGFEATIFAQLFQSPDAIEISEDEGFGSFIYVVKTSGVNRFARIDPAGVVTDFVVSPNVFSPQALVFGPRGDFDAGLYFTHPYLQET